MNELELKYGCNPNQKPSRIFMRDGGDLPLEVLNGKPGYINFLVSLVRMTLYRRRAGLAPGVSGVQIREVLVRPSLTR